MSNNFTAESEDPTANWNSNFCQLGTAVINGPLAWITSIRLFLNFNLIREDGINSDRCDRLTASDQDIVFAHRNFALFFRPQIEPANGSVFAARHEAMAVPGDGLELVCGACVMSTKISVFVRNLEYSSGFNHVCLFTCMTIEGATQSVNRSFGVREDDRPISGARNDFPILRFGKEFRGENVGCSRKRDHYFIFIRICVK